MSRTLLAQPSRSNSGHTASLVASGPLVSVVAAAKTIGIEISAKTACRWSIHGRNGRRLPTIKAAGKRLTTVAALVEWLDCTDSTERDSEPGIDVVAADRVLEAHGLGRPEVRR